MKAIIILAVALATTSASAEFMSGNELLSRMNSDLPYDRGVANGYVMGSFDAGYGVNHCPPPNVTMGQVSDMAKHAMISAPAVRHLSADSFVSFALNKVWPCPKKSGGTNL